MIHIGYQNVLRECCGILICCRNVVLLGESQQVKNASETSLGCSDFDHIRGILLWDIFTAPNRVFLFRVNRMKNTNVFH